MFQVCVNQINVHDLDLAIDFYCQKLGFEVASRDYYPKLVPLKHSGIHLVLSLVEAPSVTQYGKNAQTLINFQTGDLDETVKVLSGRGVEFLHSSPQNSPVGKFIAFKDPSGNVHEFLEYRKN